MSAQTTAAAHRAKLVCMEAEAGWVKAVDEQLHDILGYHAATVDASRPLREQFRALARDCYLQGLLDGAKVRPRDVRTAPLMSNARTQPPP